MLSIYNDIAAKKSVLYQVFEDPGAHQFCLIKKPFGGTKAKEVIEECIIKNLCAI